MRIQFSLSCQKGTIIPINYQSEISSWIFNVLANAGAELSAHVQKMGFDLSARSFKQFTFSPLAIYPYEMDQARQEFRLLGNQVKLSISIYLERGFEQQVVHLFRQTPLELGTLDGNQAIFEVKHWQILPSANLSEQMQFKAFSPISITTVEEGKTGNLYILPDSEFYDVSFFHHLVRRFKAAKDYKSLAQLKLLDPSFPMEFKLLGPSKSRLIHLKPNAESIQQLRGFTYEFEVNMPIHLMEYAYYSGFGEFPFLGFGFVEIKQ
ncbi:MAG: CRISPR-associated endoribonuclease Cas6 [Saprospiraceae bacterium]